MAAERRTTAAPGAGPIGAVLADAVRLHRRGQLDQALALYRHVLARQPDHADALHLTGVCLHQQGQHDAALVWIERAIARRSDIAAYHNSRGSVLLAQRAFAAAAQAFAKAVSLDPRLAEAHNNLGNLALRQGEAEAALAHYEHALAIRPGYAEALSNRGSALHRLGRLTAAEDSVRRALAARPDYASALANLGLVLKDQGRFDEARQAYDQALAADPAHARARVNRATLLLQQGSFREGWADYEWRWQDEGFTTPRRRFAQPAWDGQAAPGATVMLLAEQGLGSAIMFARFAPLAAACAAHVVLECQPPLAGLFRQSFSQSGSGSISIAVKGEPLPPFDLHAPLMSLPHLLGVRQPASPAGVPYLTVDAAQAAAWQQRLAALPGRRIGLVWAGNRNHANDHNRSMPAAALAPVLAVPGISAISLQVPAAADDLAALPGVIDLAPGLHDFAETAAAICGLDLVISVDTAVAHLAGALARPVWLLTPDPPEWRWLAGRDDSPWYPTLRLFRQRVRGDWDELVGRVVAALQQQPQPK
jgi:tetratricopeptide (TPR) repeat protein